MRADDAEAAGDAGAAAAEVDADQVLVSIVGIAGLRSVLDALGAGKAQLLLYNNSGEAKIEGAANARELRAALAAKAA